jgi:hypothetical protein
VSAIRGVEAIQVLEAVESYFDGAAVAHQRRFDDDPGPRDVEISAAGDGWSMVSWPAYFLPRDVPACRTISRELRAVVSTVSTTDDEGWSHTLIGCGTLLDRFHSFPAALAWDGEDSTDIAALAREWSGDHELVARVLGVPACDVRRHFCQATLHDRGHLGRDRSGYLALWAALGIPARDLRPYAALSLDPAWQRLPA